MEQGYQLTGDGDEKVTDNWYGGGTDRHYTAGGGGDILAVLDFGGCSGEDSELLLPSGEGPLPLLDEPDLLRLGRARGARALGSGDE